MRLKKRKKINLNYLRSSWYISLEYPLLIIQISLWAEYFPKAAATWIKFWEIHSTGLAHGIEIFFTALILQSFKSLLTFSLFPDLCAQFVKLLEQENVKKIKVTKKSFFIKLDNNKIKTLRN